MIYDFLKGKKSHERYDIFGHQFENFDKLKRRILK